MEDIILTLFWILISFLSKNNITCITSLELTLNSTGFSLANCSTQLFSGGLYIIIPPHFEDIKESMLLVDLSPIFKT